MATMSDYEVQARHVRYWRGAIHKWSTAWPFTGTLSGGGATDVVNNIHALEQEINYQGSGAVFGGLYEISMYNKSAGGVPILSVSYFDPDVYSGWIPYSATAWLDRTLLEDQNAEAALVVHWNAGLSATGKPVRFRKWFHSVPAAVGSPASPQLGPSDVTSLAAEINHYLSLCAADGVLHGKGSRLAASTCTVETFFGNHQMPRGRRKKVTKLPAAAFGLPAGIFVVPGSDGSLDS
jgi:hypothetical protein